MKGIADSARQLLSFGVAQEDMIGTLRMLGDIAAGANVGLEEMSAIFGKARAKGKAYTEELMQLSDRGVPIIDTLARGLGVTQERVFELASEGRISFGILSKAMAAMTAEGGIFNAQMEKQSQTLFGLFSSLGDAVSIAMSEVGKVFVESTDLKTIVADLTSWINGAAEAFRGFAAANPGMAKFIAYVGVFAAAMGPVMVVMGNFLGTIGLASQGLGVMARMGGRLLAFLPAIATGLWTAVSATAAWTAALLANPITWVVAAAVAAVAALAGAAYLIYQNWDAIAAFFERLWGRVVETFQGAFDIVAGILTGDFGRVAEGFKGILSGLSGFWGEVWEGLGSAVQSVVDAIDGALGGLLNTLGGIGDSIKGLGSWVTGWFGDDSSSPAPPQGQALTAPQVGPISMAPNVPTIGSQAARSAPARVEVIFDNLPDNARLRTSAPSDIELAVEAARGGQAMVGG